MSYFIGVDFHKSFSYLAILDQLGQVVKHGKIINNPEELRHFLSPYRFNKCSAVLEAGRNWTLMYDWLEDIVKKVSLAHPLKVKAIASAKIKTDKIDAKVLAHLLRADLIPMAYVPTKEAQQARNILRQRMFFVRLQTMLKNRIRTILDRHPELERPPAKLLFAAKNRSWFKELPLPEVEHQLVLEDLLLLNALKERIAQSDTTIESLAKTKKEIHYLQTIPGIGLFFATLITYEIDDIERFPNPKKLAAYVGLVPSTYVSGNKAFHGRITKQGNKYLRWALVEAVWPAIRKDGELRSYYQRIKTRKGANPAKVATARRLLTIVYHILKEKRSYKIRQLPSFLPSKSF